MSELTRPHSRLGDWISIHLQAGRDPLRFNLSFNFGDLPDGWTSRRHGARMWTGIVGVVCLAPFLALILGTALRVVGVNQLYDWISATPALIVAATVSLFVGIPVAVAINLWRITRLGLRHRRGAIEGLVALEYAPLHLVVVFTAILFGGLFVGHLAADSYACVRGVTSAC